MWNVKQTIDCTLSKLNIKYKLQSKQRSAVYFVFHDSSSVVIVFMKCYTFNLI